METDQLFEEYYTPLYRFIRARTPNEDEALDITQNVFLKVVKNGTEITAPRAYLFTIARTTLIDFYRKKKSIPASHIEMDLSTEHDTSVEHPEAIACTENDHDVLHQRIAELPDIYQEIIQLRFFSELEYAEIAEITGKTEVNIRKIVSRAIKALSEHYH